MNKLLARATVIPVNNRKEIDNWLWKLNSLLQHVTADACKK